MLYTLVLVIGLFGGSMTAISGFNSKQACEEAGRAFVEAAGSEREPRFYCFKG
jgi:hypothetical protein